MALTVPDLSDSPLLGELPESVIRGIVIESEMSTSTGINALVDKGELHEAEAQLALEMNESRRATFVAGRLAMSQAIKAAESNRKVPSHHRQPVLRTARGAPITPLGLPGSITHKAVLALAAVAPMAKSGSRQLQFVGIDLEKRPTAQETLKASIATRIFTPRELDALGALNYDRQSEHELVRIHFAIKEAVYKAIDPLVQRYVRFDEVELPLVLSEMISGETSVSLLLPELRSSSVSVRAQWLVTGDWIVATAFSTTPIDSEPGR